jgi:hypothetical protein
MFTDADGQPIRPEYLTHRFRRLARQLGLPPDPGSAYPRDPHQGCRDRG